MTDKPFAFNDGAAYEQMMGKWSRLVGEIFVDWLAPSQGLRWIDVGHVKSSAKVPGQLAVRRLYAPALRAR